MFSREQISGKSLPDRTLCLTFDDGPGETPGQGRGPKTSALADYLNKECIRATFFFTGIHLLEYPTIVPAITRLGHIVGNHSYSHHNMPKFFSSGGDIVSEIMKVEDLIASTLPKNIRYFRAPYGLWDESLTNCLNRSIGPKPDYKGPIHWDISCSDFGFWARAADANECAEAYLTEIGKIGRGIVLMHDSTADNDIMKRNNLTFEAIRILVPELKRLGYSFIGLDSI
jgi:peptidoglycan/xylan/chitin deacetylase (PgdA/CDA1 family)